MKNSLVIAPLLLILYGFSSKPPISNRPVPEIPPIIVNNKTVEDFKKQVYPVKGWDSEYDKVLDILLKKMPLKTPCETKLFLKAIISAESGFDNSVVFREPAPLNQNSIGFFQLSMTDKRGYGCDFTDEKSIQNPIRNLECGVMVLYKLQTINHTENIWQFGGRYFSTLRWNKYSKWSGKRQNGVNDVLTYLKGSGCAL